jgi:uncharacterized protein (TIGR03437 family)
MRALVLMSWAALLHAQPATVFSTYLGGRENDGIRAAAVDAAGNVYVAGVTSSRDFPVAGPERTSCTLGSLGGCADAFVAKIAADGSRLLYSLYYGTPGSDEAAGIAVAADGSAWVAGTANNAVFLLKVSPDGRREFVRTFPVYPLAWTHALALDRAGNAYIAGETLGPLPLTRPLQAQMGAPSCTAAGGSTAMPLDAFVMKFSPAGELLYSTYFGGSGNDSIMSIAVDPAGDIYIGGNTSSRDLPLVKAAQAAYGGGEPAEPGRCVGGDGFVAKIAADGARLLYSTYTGTAALESVTSIDVSPEGYLTLARSGPSGWLAALDPQGAVLWGRVASSTLSLVRDRAGTIFSALPVGYMTYDLEGQNPRFPLLNSALAAYVVRPLAGGRVLLAGAAPGGLQTVNAFQPSFGGIYDGGVMLLQPAPEPCNSAVLLNGASFQGPYVAPGSIAALFGCGLEGVTEVTVGTETARVLGGHATQLNVVLPDGLPPGLAGLTLKRGGAVAAKAQAFVEPVAPALFTASAAGAGPPAAVVLQVSPDGAQRTALAAACDGGVCAPVEIDLGGPDDRTYLLLFGTGIRRAGPGAVTVRARGLELPVLGFAAQSEFPGLDQVNVELPRSLAGAGKVDLLLAVDGRLANVVTLLVK